MWKAAKTVFWKSTENSLLGFSCCYHLNSVKEFWESLKVCHPFLPWKTIDNIKKGQDTSKTLLQIVYSLHRMEQFLCIFCVSKKNEVKTMSERVPLQ